MSGKAVFRLLVIVCFAHCPAGQAAACWSMRLSRHVGLHVAILVVLALFMRVGLQVYPAAVTVVAQRHLAAIGNKDERIVRLDGIGFLHAEGAWGRNAPEAGRVAVGRGGCRSARPRRDDRAQR